MKIIMFLKGQSFSRKLTMCFCVVPAVQYSNKDYEKEKRLVFFPHELRSVEDFLDILLLKIRTLFSLDFLKNIQVYTRDSLFVLSDFLYFCYFTIHMFFYLSFLRSYINVFCQSSRVLWRHWPCILNQLINFINKNVA